MARGGGRARAARRVFTVPAGRPFLRSGRRRDPEGRSAGRRRRARPIRSTFPTSRCCCRRGAPRAPCRKRSSTASGGRAMTLPHIRPISEGDEDLTLLVGPRQPGTLGTDALDLPPAVSEIERRLVLTMLVQRWSQTHARDDGDAGASWRSRRARRAPTRRRRPRTSPPSWRGSWTWSRPRTCRSTGSPSSSPTSTPSTGRTRSKFLKIITEPSGRRTWRRRSCLSPAARRNRAILAEAAAPGAVAAVWAGHRCRRHRARCRRRSS